jgi:hypothetical protein
MEARAEPEPEPEPEDNKTEDAVDADEPPVEEGAYFFAMYLLFLIHPQRRTNSRTNISISKPPSRLRRTSSGRCMWTIAPLRSIGGAGARAKRRRCVPSIVCHGGPTILILSSQGLFETSLIAYAYVSHLVALKAVPSCYKAKSDSKLPPIAALILCIQAVRRKHIVSSRTYWATG